MALPAASKAPARMLVAGSCAQAVADGQRYLAAVGATTAAGLAVCAYQLVKTKNPQWAQVAAQLQQNLSETAKVFATIGARAGEVLSKWPD